MGKGKKAQSQNKTATLQLSASSDAAPMSTAFSGVKRCVKPPLAAESQNRFLRQFCSIPQNAGETYVAHRINRHRPNAMTAGLCLVTVDGNKVPCTVQHEGHAMAVKSSAFIISADGPCSSKITLDGRDTAMEVKATYTREGQKLTMKWQGAGMTIGTVQGDMFTMDNERMVFAYRK